LFIETSTHKDDAVINTYYLYKTRFLAGQWVKFLLFYHTLHGSSTSLSLRWLISWVVKICLEFNSIQFYELIFSSESEDWYFFLLFFKCLGHFSPTPPTPSLTPAPLPPLTPLTPSYQAKLFCPYL
jgi:hypothetical protein